MANLLREIFSKELTEQDKELLEQCEKWRQRADRDKECIACKHYSFDHSVPGYVYYNGDCGLGKAVFWGKKNNNCFESKEVE